MIEPSAEDWALAELYDSTGSASEVVDKGRLARAFCRYRLDTAAAERWRIERALLDEGIRDACTHMIVRGAK